MENVQQTIISQYANSPSINQLIESMNEYIDPRTNMENFYDFVWDLNTAQGFGLDIWGKIVGVSRSLRVTDPEDYFGFKDSEYQPFDQAPFYDETIPIGTVYILDDVQYRILIITKALANISATNAQALNLLLRQLFNNRRCYVEEVGGMQVNYVFEFALTNLEYAILAQSGVIQKPAGVKINIKQTA
ncbi:MULTISPECIES: DUF2612 domain-containing protein [Acinetobacter]|uniref:DUF2612 domain-containing protein n=1 Tax=Acinetobacter TaxID=469 RepID=UPI001F4B128D|nr:MULTISPECIES: DUF2612 domain-containing protein [Acinetobacter]MCH7381597.1 DUF2612 domain-containing protein [Acinetobacter higginsii]